MFRKVLRKTVRGLANNKEIRYQHEARKALLAGVDSMAKAVVTTLGPKGRNVIIDQSYPGPKITKDGVTVAKSISFEDNATNVGAKLLQMVASNANDIAGDGTTTAICLGNAIFQEGCKKVEAGLNPMDLKRGIDKAAKAVIAEIEKSSKQVTSQEEITQVATISANNDREIGDLIGNAMGEVGLKGVITVEEGKTIENSLELVEGMSLDRGFLSPYFITDPKRLECVYNDPLILLSDSSVKTIEQIIPALQISQQSQRPLLIIADDIEGDALQTLIVNRIRAGIDVCAVKAPGFGDNKKSILQDIAVVTGAVLCTEDMGMKLEDCDDTWLGSCEKVIINKNDTLILDGRGDKQDIEDRCRVIEEQKKAPNTSEYDKRKMDERLAKLAGGVAVIYVGGSSEVEVNEKKDRIDDALHATRCAVEEGIIPGGGSTLVRCSMTLDDLETENFDQSIGVKIVQDAIKAPIKVIAHNCGLEGAIICNEIMKNADNHSFGYNAAIDKYGDMFEMGVIDPAKVVKTALSQASSIAGLMITSEALIYPIGDPDAPVIPSGAPGMSF